MPDASPEFTFDLDHFLPYLLNQAGEATSKGFHEEYRSAYDLSRTQWRVLANLGKFGKMTAAEIGRVSYIEKTSVSRAVATLETRGWIRRTRAQADKRQEQLSLTTEGQRIFAELGAKAIAYDDTLRARLGPHASAQFEAILRRLIHPDPRANAAPEQG